MDILITKITNQDGNVKELYIYMNGKLLYKQWFYENGTIAGRVFYNYLGE